MLKILTFIRRHAIALLALFIALGGTSYAALAINGNQIRNRTIDSIKLNPRSISASIRAWVIVYGDSNSASAGPSSSPVHVRAIGVGETITWPHRRFGRNCMPSVTPLGVPSTGGYGSISTQFDASQGTLTLLGFGPDKVGRPQPAYVMVVCP